MAIYSLNVSSVGRSTHAAGTAGAHIRYICRPDAEPAIMAGGGISADPLAARSDLDRSERADRTNARVIDKIRIALPVELDEGQRAELTRKFATRLTEGRVPWFAAIHQTGEDAHNPHVHLVIRDRDRHSGKRVVRLSDSARDWKAAGRPGEAPCAYLRELWEDTANAFLCEHGHRAQIDRRSLDEQGIDRTPQIHLGPRGQYIEGHIERPASKDRKERSWRRTQYRDKIPYSDIDQGRTRLERNHQIIDLNLERELRSRDFAVRSWARFEKEQSQLDRDLAGAHAMQRRGENSERDAALSAYRIRRQDALARRSNAFEKLGVEIGRVRVRKVDKLEDTQNAEQAMLQIDQSRIAKRIARVLDITGRTRRSQKREQTDLEKRHAREKARLTRSLTVIEREGQANIRAKFREQFAAIRNERAQAAQQVKKQFVHSENRRQAELQMREAQREQRKREVSMWVREQGRRVQAQEKRVALFEAAKKVYAPNKNHRQSEHDLGRNNQTQTDAPDRKQHVATRLPREPQP